MNYGEIPIPGDNMVEPINFFIKKDGLSNIKISTTFDLVLPITGTFKSEASGDEIISLALNKQISQHSNGILIQCGGSNYNNWGEMCGYYNVTDRKLTIAFGWSNGTASGSGYIFAERVD